MTEVKQRVSQLLKGVPRLWPDVLRSTNQPSALYIKRQPQPWFVPVLGSSIAGMEIQVNMQQCPEFYFSSSYKHCNKVVHWN